MIYCWGKKSFGGVCSCSGNGPVLQAATAHSRTNRPYGRRLKEICVLVLHENKSINKKLLYQIYRQLLFYFSYR